MTTFEIGDRVMLKPNQVNEDDVLAELRYGTVYTVEDVSGGGSYVSVDGDDNDTLWLARRFRFAPEVPQKGDVIEVVVRGRVASVQTEGVDRPIVYFEHDGDGNFEYDGYAPPIYLNDHVRSITVVEPAKPKLDLDALPVGSLIETFEGDRQRIYRKTSNPHDWLGMNGATYSGRVLMADSTEIFELVRKTKTEPA